MIILKVDVGKISTLCSLLDSLLTLNKDIDSRIEEAKLKSALCTTFVFCYTWAIGGNLKASSWDAFDTFVRNQFEENPDAKVTI
jgi:dynein heavy chain